MTIHDMAAYIRENRPCLGFTGPQVHDDIAIVLHHTRQQLWDYVHITDEHILECCAKARDFNDHVQMCLPVAVIDTEVFRQTSLRRPRRKSRSWQT